MIHIVFNYTKVVLKSMDRVVWAKAQTATTQRTVVWFGVFSVSPQIKPHTQDHTHTSGNTHCHGLCPSTHNVTDKQSAEALCDRSIVYHKLHKLHNYQNLFIIYRITHTHNGKPNQTRNQTCMPFPLNCVSFQKLQNLAKKLFSLCCFIRSIEAIFILPCSKNLFKRPAFCLLENTSVCVTSK